MPEDVTLEVAFDQSIYVRDALDNLRHEAILGAVLASLVVLLFLGSLRTTWIVAISIPLSLLAAFAGLYFTGETLNLMTLGGLALVLGRVVDDSVVDVENTVRHLQMGKSPFQAALDSAHEISVPVFMATVTTVVVFLPLVFMTGMGKYLFTPLAISVALALFASYLVSRTVSPLLCARFLKTPPAGQTAHADERFPPRLLAFALFFGALGLASYLVLEFVPLGLSEMPSGLRRGVVIAGEVLMFAGIAGGVLLLAAPLFWFAPTFDRLFERFTAWYERLLLVALRRRTIVLALAGALLVPAYFAFRATGQELFPDVDSSEFTLHMRASGGPRVEETENQIADIESLIRGYQATPAQVHLDVAQSLAVGDEDQIEAIREANPERREWLDRLVEVTRAGGDVQPIIPQGDGQTFAVPGLIPEEDLELMLANIGISSRWSAIYTPNNGPHAAFLRVQLRSGFAGRKTPTQRYVDRLRVRLQKRYPMHDFFIESGGMIRRILNNGALSPIEVQVTGRDHTKRREATRLLQRQIVQLASVQDAQAPQGIDLPSLTIVVDRVKASRPGLTETDIIRNVITSLMSSSQIAPNFWIDPVSGNPYVIGVQYPEYVVKGIRTLEEIPVTGGKVGRDAYMRPATGNDGTSRSPTTVASRGGTTRVVRLEDVATIERGLGPVEVYHYGATRVSQVFVSVADSDLGGVASDVEGVVRRFPVIWAMAHLPATRKELRDDPAFNTKMEGYLKKPTEAKRKEIQTDFKLDPDTLRMPKDVRVTVRGEVQSMRYSFREMRDSLALAVLLIYLVMAAQFGSWIDPLIMIVSAPLGLIGVAFMLWGTGTTLNIQSAMGVLMMVGISVSNSVLVVEFANRQRELGMRTRDAILSASCVRLRPILMTTIATLVGLLPMAIHRHPGDEMNLPLARAVIGGLAGSTILTLFVVPSLYSLLKPRLDRSVRAHHLIVGAEGPPPSDPAATFDFPSTKSDWGESAFGWPADMRSAVEPEPEKPDDPPHGRPQP